MRRSSLEMLILTLLFLAVAGLRRTWDLRSYTGESLALLSGRKRSYGYRHVERFLSELACWNESLTTALACWTSKLWKIAPPDGQSHVNVYIDGHRKPVYTDHLIPRGLIGRTGAIQGCRALVLLHDGAGHPLLITTHRGDLHLTVGAPQVLAQYEQATKLPLQVCLIIDREGMAAEFLAALAALGHRVVTILRSNQYQGLQSFTHVGAFVPLSTDEHGTVIREVASARFVLALPKQPGKVLSLWVALIRDLRCSVLDVASAQKPSDRWDADVSLQTPYWWQEGWQPTAMPAQATQAKLIPIVSTSETVDAVALARLYIQRWPLQENVIRDFLLPVGLDTNHGYGKHEVVNSEVAKQRSTLMHRLVTLDRKAQAARVRGEQAYKRYDQLYKQFKLRQAQVQAPTHSSIKAATPADITKCQAKACKAHERSIAELDKQERYCRQQREVLRALEDLKARERSMYELNHAKDQVMTVCKVALTNLVMWTRDQYFPATYTTATWKRLAPFFDLPGTIICTSEMVTVELSSFNDRQLNRDLQALCARVQSAQPCLPDGRRLSFTIFPSDRLISDLQLCQLE